MSTPFSSPVFKSFSLISIPKTKYNIAVYTSQWGAGGGGGGGGEKGSAKKCERTTPNKFLTTEWESGIFN